MKKQVIAFDLDDTLSVTKSPMSDEMSGIMRQLLEKYQVCVISGGRFEQFQMQVIDPVDASAELLPKFHMMPTCGTRYYHYNSEASEWQIQYAEDLSEEEKAEIIAVIEKNAKELGMWEENPAGEIIEDRGSQITYSALGQQAKPEDKYAWAEKNHDIKQVLRAKIDEQLPNLEVRLGGTTSVDITRIGIDKAHGMKKLMEALAIEKKDILFIGDKLQEGGNDYPVKAMGIDSIEVDGWEDTAMVLRGILAVTE